MKTMYVIINLCTKFHVCDIHYKVYCFIMSGRQVFVVCILMPSLHRTLLFLDFRRTNSITRQHLSGSISQRITQVTHLHTQLDQNPTVSCIISVEITRQERKAFRTGVLEKFRHVTSIIQLGLRWAPHNGTDFNGLQLIYHINLIEKV